MFYFLLAIKILVTLAAASATFAVWAVRSDVKENLNPHGQLKDISKQKLAVLRLFLRNSGLKREAENYIEYDSYGPVFTEVKDEFIRKLSFRRQTRAQILALVICGAAAYFSSSVYLTVVLFYIFFLTAMNDGLFINVIANNPGILIDE